MKLYSDLASLLSAAAPVQGARAPLAVPGDVVDFAVMMAPEAGQVVETVAAFASGRPAAGRWASVVAAEGATLPADAAISVVPAAADAPASVLPKLSDVTAPDPEQAGSGSADEPVDPGGDASEPVAPQAAVVAPPGAIVPLAVEAPLPAAPPAAPPPGIAAGDPVPATPQKALRKTPETPLEATETGSPRRPEPGAAHPEQGKTAPAQVRTEGSRQPIPLRASSAPPAAVQARDAGVVFPPAGGDVVVAPVRAAAAAAPASGAAVAAPDGAAVLVAPADAVVASAPAGAPATAGTDRSPPIADIPHRPPAVTGNAAAPMTPATAAPLPGLAPPPAGEGLRREPPQAGGAEPPASIAPPPRAKVEVGRTANAQPARREALPAAPIWTDGGTDTAAAPPPDAPGPVSPEARVPLSARPFPIKNAPAQTAGGPAYGPPKPVRPADPPRPGNADVPFEAKGQANALAEPAAPTPPPPADRAIGPSDLRPSMAPKPAAPPAPVSPIDAAVPLVSPGPATAGAAAPSPRVTLHRVERDLADSPAPARRDPPAAGSRRVPAAPIPPAAGSPPVSLPGAPDLAPRPPDAAGSRVEALTATTPATSGAGPLAAVALPPPVRHDPKPDKAPASPPATADEAARPKPGRVDVPEAAQGPAPAPAEPAAIGPDVEPPADLSARFADRAETTQTRPSAPALPPPPTQPVVHQVMQAVRAQPDGPIEITLSPEELGSVRLTLQAGDGSLAVQITAERPETLDLMRRHLPDLARELREMGHASLSFSFAGSGGDGPARDPSQSASAPAPDRDAIDIAETRPFAPPRPSRDGDRLDLRL